MANLKELKGRINSVKSTQKIKAIRAASVFAFACALGMSGTSVGNANAKDRAPKLVKYQKDGNDGLGLFTGTATHAYGYKDKQLPNGNWLVAGLTKEKSIRNAQMLAVYRASELSNNNNKKYVKIVNVISQEILRNGYYGTIALGPFRFGASYSIEIEFTDSPDVTNNCVTEVLRETCKTIEVSGAMQEIAPFLRFKGAKK